MTCNRCGENVEPVNHNNRGPRCPACWFALPGEEEAAQAETKESTVSDILDMVEAGELSAQEALEVELSRDQPRVTLVRQLETMSSGDTDDG